MAFSGPLRFWAAGSAKWAETDQYRPRCVVWFRQFARWLTGEDKVGAISRLYDRHGTIPEGFENVHKFFYRHHITPMLEDFTIQRSADEIRTLQAEYLSKDGKRWKK